MANFLNPFADQSAVLLQDFLDGAAQWQRTLFEERCAADLNFDWRLKMDGTAYPAGTVWEAVWPETKSRVAPYVVLNEQGEPLFIRPCVEFGLAVAIVPWRYLPDQTLVVGVVFQARPFAAMLGHSDCHYMAELPRGFVSQSEPIEAAIQREIREEMGHHVVGHPDPLGSFNTDSSFLPVPLSAFAAQVGERDLSLAVDAQERVVGVKWYPLEQILRKFAAGVTEEEFDQGQRYQVNWSGAVDWFPLLLAMTRIPELTQAAAFAYQHLAEQLTFKLSI